MRVHIEQMKSVLGDIDKNLNMMVEAIDRAIEEKSEVIIFPELALTGYLLEELVFDVGIKEVPEILLEKSKKISIIFGAVELGEEEYPYNTAYYLEDGKVIHRHRKVYLPDYTMFSEGRYFMSGERVQAFDTKFGRIGMLVCEDMWHQSTQHIMAQDGVKYLFVLANSPARLGAEREKLSHGWKTIVKAFSLLNGVYSVVANRVGVEDGITFYGNSFIVNPEGEIVLEGEYLKEQSLSFNLDFSQIRRARIKNPMFKTEKRHLTIKELMRIENSK